MPSGCEALSLTRMTLTLEQLARAPKVRPVNKYLCRERRMLCPSRERNARHCAPVWSDVNLSSAWFVHIHRSGDGVNAGETKLRGRLTRPWSIPFGRTCCQVSFVGIGCVDRTPWRRLMSSRVESPAVWLAARTKSLCGGDSQASLAGRTQHAYAALYGHGMAKRGAPCDTKPARRNVINDGLPRLI